MVPKVAHGTERVNMIKDFKVILDSKGIMCAQGSSLRPADIYNVFIK
jgi:hypothetical protein